MGLSGEDALGIETLVLIKFSCSASILKSFHTLSFGFFHMHINYAQSRRLLSSVLLASLHFNKFIHKAKTIIKNTQLGISILSSYMSLWVLINYLRIKMGTKLFMYYRHTSFTLRWIYRHAFRYHRSSLTNTEFSFVKGLMKVSNFYLGYSHTSIKNVVCLKCWNLYHRVQKSMHLSDTK